jgi:hypothetical protein
MGQRNVAGGERTTRCLSAKSTASTATTSVALHSPGPVIGADALKTASSVSRDWHGEGETLVSDMENDLSRGRSRGIGIVSDVAAELRVNKNTPMQSKIIDR